MSKNDSPKAINKTERNASWSGCELVSTKENISSGVEWAINDSRHAVIVHMGGGTMTALETELDGQGMSFAPANVGEIWIVPANSRYASRAQGNDVEYGVFFMDSSVIGDLVSNDVEFGEITPLHGVRDEFCYHAVRKLVDATEHNDDISALLSESTRSALCLHLFQTYGQASEKSSARNHAFLDKVGMQDMRAYIHSHISQTITLAHLSNLAEMSTNTFLVAFRRAFGQTPAQYIIEQRLRRAQWMLANSNKDITSIAFESGFSSHSHMSSAFRKHFNQTPSDFRTSWKS